MNESRVFGVGKSEQSISRKRDKCLELFTEIDSKKVKLDNLRPFTRGEVERLQDEFMVEFTCNSNAIEGNTLTLKETALVLEGITIGHKLVV